ncbi:ATP-dependent DNA helicase DinG [Hahella aquimaris]|uniref:ATP-dependent DNA helicase DinG n=1 Tax=Hahella sp. HNIBRBA332 TaxID=3015983 RepID=UPI00273C615B|nr:ATP-dependent DNA helicase DinG [Hahella sp. HNIBRBA332]WLQ16921.1 ATP-dependent DNA helicase DinG [Hahella sp. HNIBRBA332]
MVSEGIKEQIQSAYRKYIAARNIKPRSGQRHMIAEIARYLSSIELDGEFRRSNDATTCVVEAGTGTGKTLAYLMASIPFAAALRKKIVISTATVTLQQQVVQRELPLLAQHTDLEFKVALAKGRGRYICLHKLDSYLAGQEQGILLLDGPQESGGADVDAEAYQRFMNWMVDKGWSGDWDSAPEPIEETIWSTVTTDHRQCLNKRCSFFTQCAYYKAKMESEKAEIIVANHDLVFADLALGGGFVLPPPEETIYIFDEAHHMADKALNHFAFSAGLKSSQKMLRGLSRALVEGQSVFAYDEQITNRVSPMAALSQEMHHHLDAVARFLNETIEWEENDERATFQYRYPMGVIPEELRKLSAAMADKVGEMTKELDAVLKRLRDLAEKEQPGGAQRQAYDQAVMSLSVYQSQVENLEDVWRIMGEEVQEGHTPTARWLTTWAKETDSDVVVHVSPTNAAHLLRKRLWSRAFGCVLTSATLSVAGRFDRLAGQVGLPDGSIFAIHHSPFDFNNNCTLELCDLGRDPQDSESYLEMLSQALLRIIDDKQATLVLFSARKHMQFAARALADTKLGSLIITQDSGNKGQLIDNHRSRVDENKGSVLFGLASFAEGLDLPGDYLKHVIIAKLPFAVPDDPVEATYAEWLKSKGGNPFNQVVLPDAITRLLQACGRLLRSERDSGKISIMDRRLWTRSYGRIILNALPPYKVVSADIRQSTPSES